ncbi:MAG: hypothetical protein U9N02_01005 [Campylobacterota bacterium]|nr:hypothetical protein [Campylobacterota bacterium]
MKTYYYVHTGHRIGLDRFRRATTILRALKDTDITLLCSDFRIAHIGKEFGIQSCVGLDVVRNIPQIALHGDRLIFDSDEANPIMLEDMREFFSTFIHINSGEPIVDEKYYQQKEKTIPIAFFYGDDDYEKDLEQYLPIIKELDASLLLGFYYFLDYEDMLRENIKNCYDFEDYDEVISSSNILLTASPQAVLENLASGGCPIYIQREDYTDSFNELFEELNIPILKTLDMGQVSAVIGSINENKYYQTKQINSKIIEIIKDNLNL